MSPPPYDAWVQGTLLPFAAAALPPGGERLDVWWSPPQLTGTPPAHRWGAVVDGRHAMPFIRPDDHLRQPSPLSAHRLLALAPHQGHFWTGLDAHMGAFHATLPCAHPICLLHVRPGPHPTITLHIDDLRAGTHIPHLPFSTHADWDEARARIQASYRPEKIHT